MMSSVFYFVCSQDAQEISYDKYGRIIEKEVENDSEAHQEEEDDDKESDGDGLLKDSDVHAWSDYLKVHLHPTSVVELPFWSFNEPFSTFAAGMSRSVISDDHRCDYFDKIRKFAEECDYLRNITVLADLYDGFGGLTCSLMEEIRDEFPRMTVVSFLWIECVCVCDCVCDKIVQALLFTFINDYVSFE